MECFSMKLNKFWEYFCYPSLVVSTTLKKVFSRSNFSDNSVQVLSPMYSNVELLTTQQYLTVFHFRHSWAGMVSAIGKISAF